MEDIAQHFKKKLMCTCSVELLPGRTQKNKEVTIQVRYLLAMHTQHVALPLSPSVLVCERGGRGGEGADDE